MKAWVIEALKAAFEEEELLDHDGADFAITGAANGLSPTAFYVLDKPPISAVVRGIYERNTLKGVWTIFLVDRRLLPADGHSMFFERGNVWLQILHAVNYGRVYTYDAPSPEELYILPVHLDPDPDDSSVRTAMYSPEFVLDLDTLKFQSVDCKSRHMIGTFLVASYFDGTFWTPQKKREQKPPPKQKRNNYQPPPRQERQQYPDWDEFLRETWRYENVYGSGYSSRSNQSGQKQYTYTPPKPRTSADYDLIGISPDMTQQEAKKAYRRKAKELHPDLHLEEKEKYTQLFQDLGNAWDRIKQMNGW